MCVWLAPPDLGVEQGVHEGGLAQTCLSHAQDVEAEALADGLIHQLVRQAVKPHMSSQGDRSATFTLIWKRKKMRTCLQATWVTLFPSQRPLC